jgi:Papain family cysteine protease
MGAISCKPDTLLLRYLYSCVIVVLPALLCAQGLLMDDAAYERLPRQPRYGDGNKAESIALSEITKIDLRPYCPRPQNQGVISSCSGWATGYGALSILQAIQKGWEGRTDTITRNAFSALFVYNQVKLGSCNLGAYLDAAATLLKSTGNIRSKDFDLFKNDCERQPSPEQLQQASNYRIKDFMTLFSPGENAGIKIEKTKLSLSQKLPVVVGVTLRNSFSSLNKENPTWYPEAGDTTFFGAHAMVVVGYDDGREAFQVMNSWGTNWGDGGFGWIKYQDFGRYCMYSFQLIPHEDPGKFEVFNPRLFLRLISLDSLHNAQFADGKLFFNGRFYELSSGMIKKFSLAQLHLSYLNAGAYCYMFSYDPEGNIRIHWPRDGLLDSHFEGLSESAIITVPNVNLYIPSENAALQFEKSGLEYICILVSRNPVTDLNSHLHRLQNEDSPDFTGALYASFGQELLPLHSITYTPETLGFTNPIPKGKIAPIILQLRVE